MSKRSKASLRSAADPGPKKSSVGNVDILQRAHGMGMKIWQVEKLQRVISTINEDPAEPHTQQGRNARGISQAAGGKAARAVDLSHMLRNEQLNGPSDTVFTEDLVPFRGYYIYVRDMDEKTKPILVKEFPKPPRSESGEWPQFRANNPGKCPFMEDHSGSRHDLERANQREEAERAKSRAGNRAAPRTRAKTALGNAQPGPVPEPTQRQPLVESKNGVNKSASMIEKLPVQEICAPPIPVSANRKSPKKVPAAIPATAGPKLFGGEPAASGLQPSNVTSAIRSQMISSTAAAPGAKAGTSKEVHGLKRKVLEKNSAPALHGIQVRQRPASATGPARAEHAIPVTRQSRKRAQEKLVHIEEESTQSEDEEDVWRAEEVQKGKVLQSKSIKVKPKDPKPGYCENCREKYDDFDEVRCLPCVRLCIKFDFLINALAHRRPQAPEIRSNERSLGGFGPAAYAIGPAIEGGGSRRALIPTALLVHHKLPTFAAALLVSKKHHHWAGVIAFGGGVQGTEEVDCCTTWFFFGVAWPSFASASNIKRSRANRAGRKGE